MRRPLPRERVLALLWLAGGLLTLVTLALPYRVPVVEEVRLAIGLGALALGVVLWRSRPLGDRATHAILVGGLGAVTVCTAIGVPEIEGVFYLIVLVFVFATFSARTALAYLAAVAGLYAVALDLGEDLRAVGALVPWTLVMGAATVLLAALQAGRRDRRIATALQATLLPSELPQPEGFALAARYVPAAREADVGGDLYDAFVLPGGRLAVVVGDVAGKGLHAAAAVGPIRTAVRAHVLAGASPAEALDRSERLLGEDAPMTTVLLAVLDDHEVVWASAGHLPPVLVPSDGPPRVLTGPTRPPLGAEPGAAGFEQRAAMRPGDRLVLCTDGLVERRGEGLDAGLERLRSALAHAGPGAEGALTAALAAGEPRAGDDVAVLAVARR